MVLRRGIFVRNNVESPVNEHKKKTLSAKFFRFLLITAGVLKWSGRIHWQKYIAAVCSGDRRDRQPHIQNTVQNGFSMTFLLTMMSASGCS